MYSEHVLYCWGQATQLRVHPRGAHGSIVPADPMADVRQECGASNLAAQQAPHQIHGLGKLGLR